MFTNPDKTTLIIFNVGGQPPVLQRFPLLGRGARRPPHRQGPPHLVAPAEGGADTLGAAASASPFRGEVETE